MKATVQKWGNSLAVRIPKVTAQQTGVDQGSEVELAVENGRLVLTPVTPARYQLGDLLAEVRPENLHEEVDSGKPVGRESW